MMDLVESAPGWPLEDCLRNTQNEQNEWIRFLRQRAQAEGLLPAQEETEEKKRLEIEQILSELEDADDSHIEELCQRLDIDIADIPDSTGVVVGSHNQQGVMQLIYQKYGTPPEWEDVTEPPVAPRPSLPPPELSLDLLTRAVIAVLPEPFEWCEVPGNLSFNMMTDDVDGVFAIEPFLMAKYLVAFEQFQVFIDDPQGFKNPAWWQKLSADRKHRSAPGKQRFTHATNLPRDNVSWYDAVAFCRWLSARAGIEIRLPTEWEWQWAAQGPDGRKYPWGDKYIQGYVNIDERPSRIKNGVCLEQTTPVGSYPQGASPYGVLDMSGNVEEWCLNEHHNLKNTNLEGKFDRVLRGGSWLNLQFLARTSYRDFINPDDRAADYGFRVVCSG